MTSFPLSLDRTIVIEAPPAAVFRYFTDSARWAAWWGAGSTIDARPGGRVSVRYPNGVEASGDVVEVDPPATIVFTYGYLNGTPGPGESRVTITLEAAGRGGTRLHLRHAFAEAGTRDHHVQGWRYQLSVFANLVADDRHRDPAARIDGWFSLWSESNPDTLAAALAAIASPEVRVRDRFSCLTGAADVREHITASQRFMPGVALKRDGEARHCQGHVLVDWVAVSPDGAERGRGSNVFGLDPEGKIESVTGFWR